MQRRQPAGRPTESCDGVGTALQRREAAYNLAGTSRDHVLGFAYNPASQIASRSASNDAYAWGGAVNTSRPYAVNGLNQYVSAGPATFGYDANGNLASTVHPGVSTTSYVYDVENRLVSASGASNAERLRPARPAVPGVELPSGPWSRAG